MISSIIFHQYHRSILAGGALVSEEVTVIFAPLGAGGPGGQSFSYLLKARRMKAKAHIIHSTPEDLNIP